MPELSHSGGEIISYIEMCQAWSVSLQRGMNFHLRPDCSVILMSRRSNAPYRDQITDEGRVLIYEGHDVPRTSKNADAKLVDQPGKTPGGKLIQNGLFYEAAFRAKNGGFVPEIVAAYEKIHAGIWAFNGLFGLTGASIESDGRRKVYRFRLELIESAEALISEPERDILHTRVIPSAVKLEVWQRDKGKCALRGRQEPPLRSRASLFQRWRLLCS